MLNLIVNIHQSHTQAPVILDEVCELSPLLLKRCVLPLSRQLECGGLAQRLVLGSIRLVGSSDAVWRQRV